MMIYGFIIMMITTYHNISYDDGAIILAVINPDDIYIYMFIIGYMALSHYHHLVLNPYKPYIAIGLANSLC